MKKYLLFFILISFFLYGKTIRLTNGEWPPYLSEKLPDYGIASKIVTDAFNAVGIDVKYGFYPWKRSFIIAEENIWDGSLIWAKTAEREKTFYYSKEPVLNLNTVAFYKKDSGFRYTDISDLKGKKVGISLGYTYGNKFNKMVKSGLFKVETVPTDLDNFKKLLMGRIDLFLCNEEVGKLLIKKNYFLNEQKQFIIAKEPLGVTGFYLILNKKNSENKKIMEVFDRGFKIINKKGK